MVTKSVFIVFFSGERSKNKIEKICDSYGATKYSLPESGAAQGDMLRQVEERLRDLTLVIDKTNEYRLGKLNNVSNSVAPWMLHVQKEKAVYHTLNKFNYDITHKCLIAEAWAPLSEMDAIREALRRGTAKSGASVQTVLNIVRTRETPPTFFRNSKITKGTQAIVDAYGMAKYQEFNPAVFSVITFPFLFGVMFGDIGHGIMMALAGGLLCFYEQKLSHLAADEMLGTVYKGRYNILLMGIFATYSGFIYNELFAVPSETFGKTMWCSGEMMDDKQCQGIPGINNMSTQKWPRSNLAGAWDPVTGSTGEEVVWNVYPFGSDPGWAHTSNKLNSVNSFKMKFAIIAGVVQMVAGVCCKLMNCLYFKDSITMYFVFIPEMVFINSIFGYLCVLIMKKWTTNWDATFVLNNDKIVSIPQVSTHIGLVQKTCWIVH
jgi:V-type H+-transporting ATPase subunit a